MADSEEFMGKFGELAVWGGMMLVELLTEKTRYYVFLRLNNNRMFFVDI